MNIAFRVDASTQIGTGHFMRCLTLADALHQGDSRIRFVSRHLPEHLRNMLAKRGHEFMLLESVRNDQALDEHAHANWLGVSQAQDASDSIQALSDETWNWLVVDHYALDSSWETVLRQVAKNIFVIDDIADRQHDCDVLLDQNFHADMNARYIGKVPTHCKLLLGPRYALLREEFLQFREQVAVRKGAVKRILVFFGGMDADNYTGLTIQALNGIGVQDMHVEVVIGAQHPFREAVEAACFRYNYSCIVQTDKMAELMAAADLSIGAGGSATWERCCLGLPAITICTAHNQREQVADAASEGLLYAPEVKDGLGLVIEHHVSSLMENSCLRQHLSRNGMRAVDGRGSLRVIGCMGCNGIKIRTAKADDSERLFEWRNHPRIRAVSRNTDTIKWADHCRWFDSVLSDPNRLLLIGQHDEMPVGVVRFDVQNDQAEVSIYLAPEVKTSVRGHDLLQSAEQQFSRNYPKVSILRAHALRANERSQHLFLAAGYEVESTSYLKRIH